MTNTAAVFGRKRNMIHVSFSKKFHPDDRDRSPTSDSRVICNWIVGKSGRETRWVTGDICTDLRRNH